MMLTLLRINNVVLIIAMVACIAGTLAGLIVLLPFVAGAWFANLMALVGYEEHERPGWIERIHVPEPVRSVEASRAMPPASSRRAA